MSLSLDASLKNLRTHYVDILYLHFWVSCEKYRNIVQVLILRTGLHHLDRRGHAVAQPPREGWKSALSWNFRHARLDRRQVQSIRERSRTSSIRHLPRTLQRHVRPSPPPSPSFADSERYRKRDFERDIIPMALDFGMALAPWGAMGSGRFLSATQLEAKAKAGEKIRSMGGEFQTPEEVAISTALEKVAKEIGGKASVTGGSSFLHSSDVSSFLDFLPPSPRHRSSRLQADHCLLQWLLPT